MNLIAWIFGSTLTLITLLRLRMKRITLIISMLGGFEQAANSVDKNSKKSTRAIGSLETL